MRDLLLRAKHLSAAAMMEKGPSRLRGQGKLKQSGTEWSVRPIRSFCYRSSLRAILLLSFFSLDVIDFQMTTSVEP